MHGLGSSTDEASRAVDLQLAESQHGYRGQLVSSSAERSPHPREQLLDVEGLCDVVVCAGVERFDLVGTALPHREHDHRDVGPRAESPDHLRPL
jgi:hypothetical protein